LLPSLDWDSASPFISFELQFILTQPTSQSNLPYRLSPSFRQEKNGEGATEAECRLRLIVGDGNLGDRKRD